MENFELLILSANIEIKWTREVSFKEEMPNYKKHKPRKLHTL